MNRTVNLKAVLVLMLGAVCLGVGTHLVHGFQVKRNARDLSEESLQLEQEGQLREAAESLSLYLGFVPSDTDALARYGLLLNRLAQTGREHIRAFLILDQVLSRDGEREDIRRQVARLALQGGRLADARRNLDILLKGHPEDAEILQLQGRCELATGHPDLASKMFAKSILAAPHQIDLCVEYALLLRERLDQPEAADEVIEGMLRARENERSVPARLAAVRYHKRVGSWTKAEKHIQFALKELASQDAEAFLLGADVAAIQGKWQAARQFAEAGMKLHPHDSHLRQRIAQLEFQNGQPQKARQYLKPLLEALPKQTEELWSLANVLIDMGEFDQAGGVIKGLNQSGFSAPADYLQARILVRQQAWSAARVLLEKARSGSGLSAELAKQLYYLLAECYQQLGNPAQQLSAYRRALESDPHWLPARRGLASCLAVLGERDQAIVELRKMVPVARQTDSQSILQTAGARAELVQLLLERNLRLPVAERRWTEVEELLNEIKDEERQAVELRLLRAKVLVARNQLKEARRSIEAERDRDPKQVQPWLLLVELAQMQGQPESVLPLLEEAERRAGSRVEWYIVRARLWSTSNQAGAQEHLRKIEGFLEHCQDHERDRLLTSLAEAYSAIGDLAAADRLWGQLAAQQPNHLTVRLLLFEKAVLAGQKAEAQRLLGEIKRIEGEGGVLGAYGAAAYGVLLAKKGDKKALTEARQQLAQAETLYPTWSRLPLLAAQISELENRKDRALKEYQTAIERGENRVPVFRRVLQLLYEQGRYAEANALLRKIPEQARAMPALRRVAVELSILSPEEGAAEDLSRQHAMELARQAVADNSKDYHDYLWLGQIAWLANQPQEAEKALRQARQLAEAEPDTWVTLILFLARTDPKRAEAEMAEAQRKLAKNQIAGVLAPGYEALGRMQQAEEQYQAVLAAQPDDPGALHRIAGFYERVGQLAKAEPSLRKLLDPKTYTPETTVVWARRALSMVLATKGNYAQFREALALLEENSSSGGGAVEDRRVKALVLAMQPAHRREAIRLFETLFSPHNTSTPPDVQFLLAQLYAADGRWHRAHEYLSVLVRVQENNPVYLAQYARSWMHQGDVEEALRWADKLAVLAPHQFATIELRARILEKQGKSQEATNMLKTYAQEKDARLDLAALLFDQLGHSADAEKMYRAHVATSKHPEAILLLAQHLGRHERVAEALELCARALQSCPVEAVAATSVEVIRAGHVPEQQLQQWEHWLTTAVAKHPKPGLLASLAELQVQRGRHDKALLLYRQILQQDDQNVVALNNLAYLLALKEGNREEAGALIESAIQVAGPAAELLDTRAVIHLNGNQAGSAIKELEQAVLQTPSPSTYFHLAQAHRLSSNRPAAITAFRKALDLGLRVADVPLEQAAYQQLAGELDRQ